MHNKLWRGEAGEHKFPTPYGASRTQVKTSTPPLCVKDTHDQHHSQPIKPLWTD